MFISFYWPAMMGGQVKKMVLSAAGLPRRSGPWSVILIRSLSCNGLSRF